MIKIVSFKICPFVQRVTALLEAKHIPYEVEYIDDIAPPLEADLTAEQRAVNRAWSYQAAKNYLVQCSAMRSADATSLDERSGKLSAAFETVERALGDGPYFNGDTLGNVDLAWLVLLHRADIIRRHTGYDFLARYPKVQAWQANLLNTGLAKKSVSEYFEKVFTDFYLSEATYLGGSEILTASASAFAARAVAPSQRLTVPVSISNRSRTRPTL
jgi:glutathione S-transferase